MTFAIYNRKDNWNTLGYNYRFLDALASIFAIKSSGGHAVSAVYYKEKFYLSFSGNYSDTVKKQINAIKEAIKEGLHEEKMLAGYLLYNMDFSKRLENLLNLPNLGVSLQKQITALSSFIQLFKGETNLDKILCGLIYMPQSPDGNTFKILQKKDYVESVYIRSFCKEQNKDALYYIDKQGSIIELASQENLEIFDTNIGIYIADTVSYPNNKPGYSDQRTLYFYLENEELYCSYSSKVVTLNSKENKPLIDKIKGCLSGQGTVLPEDESKLLKFIEKKSIYFYTTKKQPFKALTNENYEYIEKQIGHSFQGKEFYSILNAKYFELLNSIKNCPMNIKNDVFSALIRPLQDTKKLHYYLSKEDLSGKDISIQLNPLGAHADVNVLREFFHNGKNIYVGVSKLCCGICYYVIKEDYNFNCRGTHGTCDEGWKPHLLNCPQYYIDLQNKDIRIKEEELRSQLETQDRDISDDEEIEKDIILDKFNKSLWELKSDLSTSRTNEGGHYPNLLTLFFPCCYNNHDIQKPNRELSGNANIMVEHKGDSEYD